MSGENNDICDVCSEHVEVNHYKYKSRGFEYKAQVCDRCTAYLVIRGVFGRKEIP